MKCLIENHKNELAIEIYEKYKNNIRLNNISHLLFLKACINIGQYEKGNRLFNYEKINMNSFDIQFITHLINF